MSQVSEEAATIVAPLTATSWWLDLDSASFDVLYFVSQVSKEEYDTCRITNPNPRIIAICDKPYKLMYFTITFRSFTPQPGGLEFQPGQDYYFICESY